MRSNNLRLFLMAGVVLAALLLVRFAWDLTTGMPLIISGPFWLLVAASIAISISNLLGVERYIQIPSLGRSYRVFFLTAIPLGFLASSLDCTGLSLSGCTTFCTFVKTGWVPIIGLTAAAYYWLAKPVLLGSLAAMSFVPIAPHCLCYNAANAWWIDVIGKSPECYSWGLMVSVIAISALLFGRRPFVSMMICTMIITGSTAFFIGHHYFRIPW